ARTTRETPQGAARAVLRHWNFARDPSEKSSRADRTRQLSLLRTGRRSRAAAGPVVWRRRGPYAVLSAARGCKAFSSNLESRVRPPPVCRLRALQTRVR